MASGNTVANLTGIAIPPLGVLCRRLFKGNPWLPFFAGVSAFHMVCAALFCKLASVRSAASMLAERSIKDGLGQAKAAVAESNAKRRASGQQEKEGGKEG